jgi:hypothetical protein
MSLRGGYVSAAAIASSVDVCFRDGVSELFVLNYFVPGRFLSTSLQE